MINVLSVASECAPLVKTGGLADVVGALPAALKKQGAAVRTIIPGYPAVMAALKKPKKVLSRRKLFGGPFELLSAKVAGLDLLVLDAPHLYDREGNIYLGPSGHDWPDNPQRFAALCWVAAMVAKSGVEGWKPDVVHMHDWQAGLTPIYMQVQKVAQKVGTVMTVHNIAFHGLAPASQLNDLMIPSRYFTSEGIEFWGQLSALKAGLVYADKLTTVSPTYALELMTPDFGMGLDGVLRARNADLTGIVNGIDTTVWNPATDKAIHAYKTPAGKAKNKADILQKFGLDESYGPLCVVVSRLTHQKGLNMLLQALPVLTARGGQIALLGSGDTDLERAWMTEAKHNPAVGVHIGYDEALSHKIIAGGDAILVPSRFEPCGLTQLYGLRYGTIPLVAMTGGLTDTVINASPAGLSAGVANGIQFQPVTTDALATALDHLCDLYEDKKTWGLLQKNAMKQPVGWEESTRQYMALYQKVTNAR